MEEKNQLAKWLAGKMNAPELEAFQKMPGFETYDKIAHYSKQLESPQFDSAALYRNVISHEKKTAKAIPLHSWLFRVAAVLVVAFGSWAGLKNSVTASEAAANGQTAAFTLPDNSEVVLNSDSEIHYKKWNWSSQRSLHLNGEAFFKVSKGKTFDVDTNLGKVTVVGTQFNVKARGKRLEVECFEGKVWVRSDRQKAVVTKGVIVVIENGRIIPATATDSQTPAWMRDEIRIISLPLNEVLSEIERSYAISIDRQNLGSAQRFTGILPKTDLETALQIVGDTYRFDFKSSGKNKVVLTQK